MDQLTPNQQFIIGVFIGLICTVVPMLIWFVIGAAKIDRRLDAYPEDHDQQVQDRLNEVTKPPSDLKGITLDEWRKQTLLHGADRIAKELDKYDHVILHDLDKKKGI